MRYVSTRQESPEVDFTTAMVTGLAPDGGLYVPTELPTLPEDWETWSYQDSVAGSLRLFGATEVEGPVIGASARFDHPSIAPIREVGDRKLLELFWGPTLSFKDHALQVVARLLDHEVSGGTILGATSGDTGSAAIEAFRKSHHLEVVILYPEGMVSEVQRRQMTTVEDLNITAVAVRGTFDDCQALVKDAFAKDDSLLAINSINWARIACQVGYYIYAGAHMAAPFDVVVPTGNFGNALSCWTAKQMGVPIETITIANNANHHLSNVVQGLRVDPPALVATSAPAMDIAVPSNFERFADDPTVEFAAGWSTDVEIAETISTVHADTGYVIDPHTATAWRAGEATRSQRPQLVVSTAHPAKFAGTVEAAIGQPLDLPETLEVLANRPERVITIDADPSELAELIR